MSVLNSAERLFTLDGYRATTVDALAKEADVALSSIYANFPGGKADVYAALACRTANDHVSVMRAATTAQSPKSTLLNAFDAYVEFHSVRPLAFRLLALTDVDDQETELIIRAREHIDSTLLELTDELAAGIEAPTEEAKLLVLLAWATINGILSLRHRGSITQATADTLIELARADSARRLEDLENA
ncbi:TetR/AcrR family transcriptional regulator [Rhodococcus sp. MSC1_016]|jgi:AcrR family transcriptional regulator|uniref:TetR/AcrR family transcriptional regulator n=1 Tax=Rhodococcus sp. MSC1_016 TaxID=2909266 RepID=UPI00202FE531|nr:MULTISPECIES: TetR/AcrR family transcriptional regulator [Rhodococcus]GLK33396.1 hypothetical protein GCM10017611_02380 [Rhodococcus wratislaviensis]